MFRDQLCGLTVSVHCADFLAESVKWNRGHFDSYVVVTSPEDKLTQAVARRYNLRLIVTADASRDGDFSKGRLIERGLKLLPADCWVLHLDSDIVLQRSFRHDLARAHLDPEAIHGCDRVMVKSWEQWKRLEASGWLDGASPWHPHSVDWPAGLAVGSRWSGGDGWCPIGFWCLHHRTHGGEEVGGARVKSFPLHHGNACRTDVQFSSLWDRRKRVLVPEVIVAHLESEPAKTGANWRGRTTRRFGPACGDDVVPLVPAGY